ARRPLLLDAAMGTRLLARGLDLTREDPCLWCLDRPDEVLDIHRRDIAAGSDALLTNTFGANRITLARLGYQGEVIAINRRAVALAREAAGPDRFVLGSIGPQAAYDTAATREQVLALAEAGVDALFLETHTGHAAQRRLHDLHGLTDRPILVALSQWGDMARPNQQTVSSLGGYPRFGRDDGVSAFGSNCLIGMEETLRVTKWLRGRVDVPLIAKPSAGLPHQPALSSQRSALGSQLSAISSLRVKPSAGHPLASPASFAAAVPRLLAFGVRLFGGCCGTTEAHIAALRAALDQLPGSAGVSGEDS
ncbi:MAG: homocysteine S-methyltransferase family protein, partial [Isosphaeraceae bacterium]|nr:homocysteine S-methyltransferase family protein [Isosphaeraceae bacterium]